MFDILRYFLCLPGFPPCLFCNVILPSETKRVSRSTSLLGDCPKDGFSTLLSEEWGRLQVSTKSTSRETQKTKFLFNGRELGVVGRVMGVDINHVKLKILIRVEN